MSPGTMSFVIINADQWRGDYLGYSGHPLIRTPHVDRIAAEGTSFENCFCRHTVCSPSRCSFVTGWYPHVAGHRNLTHLLQEHEPNLFGIMRDAGYEVAWFGKNDMLSRDAFPRSSEIPFNSVNLATIVCSMSLLEERYYSMYSADDVPPLRPAKNCKPEFYRRIRETRGLDRLDETALRRINAVYLGSITVVDALIGRVLSALERLGLEENTTVIIHSDHGEWAGDYGLTVKWSSALDDSLTNVPLIIRTPGGAEGHVVREPVELFDQMATILDLAGVRTSDVTPFARDGALIEPERETVASLLRRAGYRTACFGKWHLGWDWATRNGDRPSDVLQFGLNEHAKRASYGLTHIGFTKPIAGGPVDRGFDCYFGVDVPNFPPYAWFVDNYLQKQPTEENPSTCMETTVLRVQTGVMRK